MNIGNKHVNVNSSSHACFLIFFDLRYYFFNKFFLQFFISFKLCYTACDIKDNLMIGHFQYSSSSHRKSTVSSNKLSYNPSNIAGATKSHTYPLNPYFNTHIAIGASESAARVRIQRVAVAFQESGAFVQQRFRCFVSNFTLPHEA